MQGYYPVSISLNVLILIKIYFSLNEGDLNDKLVSSTHKILFKKLIIFVQMNKWSLHHTRSVKLELMKKV